MGTLTFNKLTEAVICKLELDYMIVQYANLTKQCADTLWIADGLADPKDSLYIKKLLHSNKVHEEDAPMLSSLCTPQRVAEMIEDPLAERIVRYREITSAKSVRWRELVILPAPNYSKDNVRVFLYIRDIDSYISKLEEGISDLRDCAMKDCLTGVMNRHAFNEAITSKESSRTLAVFADVNCLKEINDSDGHRAGDEWIIETSKFLSSIFGSDNCYRIGGDEFVAIVPNISPCKVETITHKLKVSVPRTENNIPKCAVGSSYLLEEGPIEPLVYKAETDMYRNKQQIYAQYGLIRR